MSNFGWVQVNIQHYVRGVCALWDGVFLNLFSSYVALIYLFTHGFIPGRGIPVPIVLSGSSDFPQIWF